jgi:hypothetical protein
MQMNQLIIGHSHAFIVIGPRRMKNGEGASCVIGLMSVIRSGCAVCPVTLQ